mmetsp:Transcript_12054/g.27036  ORF Transcript_12054/g.27036 Transcript_12054/m.27036 type:complete len:212 (+) Transcript_12054:1912-2547(+)
MMQAMPLWRDQYTIGANVTLGLAKVITKKTVQPNAKILTFTSTSIHNMKKDTITKSMLATMASPSLSIARIKALITARTVPKKTLEALATVLPKLVIAESNIAGTKKLDHFIQSPSSPGAKAGCALGINTRVVARATRSDNSMAVLKRSVMCCSLGPAKAWRSLMRLSSREILVTFDGAELASPSSKLNCRSKAASLSSKLNCRSKCCTKA